jgi:hypothetical protein
MFIKVKKNFSFFTYQISMFRQLKNLKEKKKRNFFKKIKQLVLLTKIKKPKNNFFIYQISAFRLDKIPYKIKKKRTISMRFENT